MTANSKQDEDFLKALNDLYPKDSATTSAKLPPVSEVAPAEPLRGSLPFEPTPPPPAMTAFPPLGAVGARPEALDMAARQNCVLIGPSKAGKTCLLASMGPACFGEPVEPGCTLTLVNNPELDPEGKLSRYVVQWIGRDVDIANTEEVSTFEVEISSQLKGGFFRPAELIATTIRCSDGPGGGIFWIEEDRDRLNSTVSQRLMEEAVAATTIVFVVDSVKPALELIKRHLPRLIDHMASTRHLETPPQSFVVRFMQKLGLSSTRDGGRRRRIRASRVLLLLTKIDVIASDVARDFRAQGEATTPLEVAESFDPVAIALELLGAQTLRHFRQVLDLDAEFAVGVASSTGFVRDTGESFIEWARDREPEERLKAWRSFGIQEALLFMTAGRCVGPVRRVTREDDLVLEGQA
jgi:hypothetical protein